MIGVIDTGATEGELSRLFLHKGSDSPDGAFKNQDEDGNGFVDDTYGTNISTRRGFPATESSYGLHAHGTHVAGLVLGGLRSEALNRQVKARIEVSLINLVSQRQELTSSSQLVYRFSIPLTNLIDAVAYARKDPPIPILNLSVETGRRPDVFERAGLGEYLAIVAAGNSGENIVDNTPYYPAASSLEFPKTVLTVGALAPDGTLASFSNRGAAAVAIAAPGCNVESTLPGGQTGPMSGTSQAAPQVTFAAALLYSEGFAIDRVRNRLLASAVRDDLPADQVAYGRLDVIRALQVNDDVVTIRNEKAPVEGLIQSPSCLNVAGSCLGWDRVLRIQAAAAGLLVYSQNNGGQLQSRWTAVPSGRLKLRIGDDVRDVPWTDVTDVLLALRRPAT